ncbi:unnamed protein product [Oreochromis niloticus]|nr:unnamed protein product [Mustela putorius furo]
MGGGIDPIGESYHATWGTKAEKRAEDLLGMWAAGSPSPRLSPRPPGSGKRHGVCINGTMQDPGAVSRPPVPGVTTQLRAHGGAQRPCRAGDGQVERLVLLGRTWVGSCWYAPLVVNGLCCSALVDTGSSATVLRPDAVGRGDHILPTMVKLQTVTGERAPMLGEALLTLGVGRKSVRCSVWVADLEDCILGLDVLRALDCINDTGGRGGTLSFPDGGVVRMNRRTRAEENCDGLTASEQGLLWQLLLDFKDCFSLSEDDMGHTDLIQHDIDTGDAQPIRMRPRRLPLTRQAAAERALREMQRAGLIEPSTSPWASLVVMVPNKVKDDWRFCVDFRPLNKVTKKDPYPLPCIDETLDTVAGSSRFSSLDLRSGYWQVPLAPDASPKTAFITSGGLWQFKVLPFGLCNAPATFERLMDKVLTGIPRGECVVYLDDILVHGASFHAALGALRRVLERVLAAGLKLNPRKCCLMQREVAFLGHRLGAGGVGTMDDKIQAVKDWPTPRSVQELKSLLGLASYYRRFVRGFSCIAVPLFHLLQKGVTFQWTAGCQDGCHYCERKEAQEEDELVPDVKCAVMGMEEWPSCQRLVAVAATEWRHQQEEDADIRPVLGWIEEQRQPQWEEIAMLSRATKGLWSVFNALRRHDGVLQMGWKEPAMGEMSHVPLVLMPYRSAVQDSTSCSPALLTLAREIRTPVEMMMMGRPPDADGDQPGPDYARKLQDRMESAHDFARRKLISAGARQKRNYDVHSRGRHFNVGELVWVYNPQRKKGRCPKLSSDWVGPCKVLECLGEVVYRVQLPPRGRRVALHRDRLAPYRGAATALAQQGGPQTDLDSTPTDSATTIVTAPTVSPGPTATSDVAPPPPPPGLLRPRRHHRPPGYLRDFIRPRGRGTLRGQGSVKDWVTS